MNSPPAGGGGERRELTFCRVPQCEEKQKEELWVKAIQEDIHADGV